VTPPDWALARVPGLEDGQPPLRLEPLEGGSVNLVYRVDSSQGRFVLRIDGAAWRRPGVDRERELALHRVAAAGGIAPQIVTAEPASQGLLISEYHDGRLWDAGDFEDVAALRRLGERLYALHRLPPPPVKPFNPLEIARGYITLIAPAHAGGLTPGMQRLERLCEHLRQSDLTSSVVHTDLWQTNLLQGARLWLLDWEYAQLSDPLMDIACLLAYYPAAQRYREELMAAAGFDAGRLDRALSERVDIYRMLTWLWRLARGEPADPP
jgi:thiamine kinase